jgi:hypothetical protein
MQLSLLSEVNITSVVNKSRSTYDVYIGRGSKWGNPYIIGKDGSREDVIRKYESDFNNGKFSHDELLELQGKKLGCFCKPLACHGDILAEYLNNLTIEGDL